MLWDIKFGFVRDQNEWDIKDDTGMNWSLLNHYAIEILKILWKDAGENIWNCSIK